MRRLLVPVDLTETPHPDLRGAFSLARACGAQVHIVEFMPTPAAGFRETENTVFELGYAEQEMLNVEVVKQHASQVNNWAADFRRHGIEVEGRIINDTFNAGLKKYIKKHHIDLIVMHEEGTRNWLELLTGSRSDRAIENNDCPVLTVQEPFEFDHLEELVLAVDFMREYEVENWDIVRELSACLGIKTAFLYVNDDMGDIVKLNNRIHIFREKYGFANTPVYFIQSEKVEQAIVRFAERNKTCMVAMISRAKSGPLRIFANSISEAVSRESDMPVLTISE